MQGVQEHDQWTGHGVTVSSAALRAEEMRDREGRDDRARRRDEERGSLRFDLYDAVTVPAREAVHTIRAQIPPRVFVQPEWFLAPSSMSDEETRVEGGHEF